MQDFRNLDVWARAHRLTVSIHKVTDRFPRSEMFGLSAQLRRTSASVATNLAEGCGRTQAEFARFVQISFGSACEVEYQLLLGKDLGFVTRPEYENLTAELVRVKRMLSSLMSRLQSASAGRKRVNSADVRNSTATP